MIVCSSKSTRRRCLAAPRARLAEVAVDPVHAVVALAREAQLERAAQVVVDRRRERLDLVVAEVGREPERRELRLPEDLVRVGATDAGQRALVAEQRVELAALAAEDLSERRCVDVERVGTEVRELGVELRRVSGATRRRASSCSPR